MIKKQKDWEQLHQFISWEYYESLSKDQLQQLIDTMAEQTRAIWPQIPRAEQIWGRSRRFKAVTNAEHLRERLQGMLKQISEMPTHTHQL